MVKGPVEWAVGRRIRAIRRVFEEKYDAVEGLQGYQLGGIEREELFELDIFDAEVLDEGCEDALGVGSAAVTNDMIAKEAYCVGLDCEERLGVSGNVSMEMARKGTLLVFQPPLMLA